MQFTEKNNEYIREKNRELIVTNWLRGIYCLEEIQQALGIEETKELLVGEIGKKVFLSRLSERDIIGEGAEIKFQMYVNSFNNPEVIS